MNQPVTAQMHPSLDDSRRRLEAVLNNATVAIFLMDDRQCCIYMNRAAEDLTGWTMAEVLALDRPLHDIIHHTYPDGRPFPLNECAIDRAFPEHNRTQGQEIFIHKDGRYFPVAFTASPILDAMSQTVGTIIEVRDISEERRAQERQQLLMNELNHRVKNTLATVQSLAWQSFREVDRRALDDFNGRLLTLSRAHNVLTEAAWHKAPLHEVVRVALEPFGSVYADGPAWNVHPKVAVSLSMVLYELGTNAIKYGSLSVPEGHVSLTWACAHQDGEAALSMIWEEKDGPRVVAPARRGFGSRLIERQLAMEFGGSARLDFRTEGLRCTIYLNLPRILEPLQDEAEKDDSAR